MINLQIFTKYNGIQPLPYLSDLMSLGLRIWIAQIFFQSFLTKIQSWQTTLMLFEYEYEVPVVSPVFAAWSGTIAELVFPVLLVLGLLSRPATFGLFVFNIVAMISYPDLSDFGFKEHAFWGLAIAIMFVYGPGKLSADHYVNKFLNK